MLLDAGANVNYRDQHAITPYHLAYVGGHSEIKMLLENRDADKTAPSFGQRTKLFFSSPFTQLSAKRWVAEKRAQLETSDEVNT